MGCSEYFFIHLGRTTKKGYINGSKIFTTCQGCDLLQ